MVMGAVNAQNITGYRYWYNDDMANIITQTVDPAQSIDLAAALPTTGMEPGYHRITIQFSDGTDWSAPLTNVFKRSGANITGYRYWLNNDPSTLTSVSVTPGDLIQLNSLLANVSTDRDYNLVTIQFMDSDGEYSAPLTQVYVKGIGKVSGYEYWIDDEIDARITGSIDPVGVADLIADLPTYSDSGDHLFTIRFKGDPEGWSVPMTTEFFFFTSVAELKGISDVTVFPNPTTAQIGVRLTTLSARRLEVSVIDSKGTLVEHFQTWNISGTAYQNWNVERLTSGRYFLLLVDGIHSWSVPFVKY